MHYSKPFTLQVLVLPLLLFACQGQSAESGNNGNESNTRQTNANESRPELNESQPESNEPRPEQNQPQQEQNGPEVRITPGHIVMMVSDLERSRQFYEEHLNFHTTEELVYDGLHRIFMSASDKHHELVLLESRVEEFPPVDHRQLQQVAFEVPTHEVLVEYYMHIKETDIPYVVMDNQVGLSLYFTDPDGVTVEIYWDITDQPFGEQEWRGNQIEITEEMFLNPSENLEE